MINKEVRQFLDKVKHRQHPLEDILLELARLSPFLSVEDLEFIQAKIKESYN